MTTLESVITGAMSLGRYSLCSHLRNAQRPENPAWVGVGWRGGLLAIFPTGGIFPFPPILANIDPRHGGPSQLEKTAPSRASRPYAIITGNPEDSP